MVDQSRLKIIQIINKLKHYNYTKPTINAIACTACYIVTATAFATEYQAEHQYKQDPKYGNSQSVAFSNAVYGTTPALSQEDAITMKSRQRVNNNHKFFVRLGANIGTSAVLEVKNQSTASTLRAAKIASASQKSKSKHSAELGWGYKFDRISLELEVMFTENIKYDKDPLFSNDQGSIKSVVKAQSILVNAYYDFARFSKLNFFVGAGIGNGLNRTNSLFANHPLSNNEYFAKRKIAGAYNLVLGSKLNLTPQFYLGGYLRYTNFSGIKAGTIFPKRRMQWRDELLNLNLTGEHSLIAVGITLTHLFL
jgi:opacity protein-like surface antigen